MRRREVIALLGGAAMWPFAAYGEQASAGKPVIGFLGATTPTSTPQRTAAFVQRLGELGWIDGQTMTIEYRWAQGQTDRAAQIAEEFVRLNVSVIVTSGTPAVVAAKQVTSTIPIVFAVAADPVGNGLVASLSRPGANVTGLSNQSADLAGKRIELLGEVKPGIRAVGVLTNADNPDSMRETSEFAAAAKVIGGDVVVPEIRRAEDIGSAFESFRGRAEALYVVADPLINTSHASIHHLAMEAQLPAIYNAREFAEAGGIVSYGPHLPDLFRRAADHVDRILRGTRPAEIPVEQPTKFELVINLKTARALGLTISSILLARADEVIE